MNPKSILKAITLASTLIVSSLLTPSIAVSADALKIGITATIRSFGAPEAGVGLSGFNVEVTREACKRMKAQCELVEMPFKDVIPAVARGELDIGVANTLMTPERAKLVAFSIPYWRSTSSFLGKSDKQLPDFAELLALRTVCVIATTRQEAFLRSLPGASPNSIRAHPSNQATIDALARESCDFALIPTMQSLPFLQSSDGAGFSFRGLPLVDYGLGGDVRMVVDPKRPELRQRLDEALAAMIRDGTHERISRRYFPFSIL